MPAPPVLDVILENQIHHWIRHKYNPHGRHVIESMPSSPVRPMRLIMDMLDPVSIRQSLAVCTRALLVAESASPGLAKHQVLKQRWRRYYEYYVRQIQESWSKCLPREDAQEAKRLKLALTLSTTQGVLVDFNHAGARSGYVFEKLRIRGAYLVDLLIRPEISFWDLYKHPSRVVSVGGGPGFDAVGMQLLGDFLGEHGSFTHEVIDIEPGWEGTIATLEDQLKAISVTTSTRLHFATADLLKDIPICKNPEQVNLYIFSYVCVENAVALMEMEFRPLVALFEAAAPGAVFAFMDSTDALWPDILQAANKVAPFQPKFVYKSHKVRMFLRRVETVLPLSAKDQEILRYCSTHSEAAKKSRSRIHRDQSPDPFEPAPLFH